MRCASWSVLLRACLREFLVETCYEPGAIADGNVVAFPVRETHIVHQQERLLEVDLTIFRRQAKKSWRPAVPAPR